MGREIALLSSVHLSTKVSVGCVGVFFGH
jgi:hypothetical protein